MDRELPPAVVTRRRLELLLRAGAVVVLVALVLSFARGRLAAGVRRADLHTVTVDRGPVVATLEATGLVLPERESVLASPADTRILRVLRAPGDTLSPGDPILELDTADARLALERLEQQLALKRNAREQARLGLERTLADLAADDQTLALELGAHQQQAARDRRLHELGLVAADAVRASLDLVERDRIALARIQARREEARRELAVKVEAFDLEASLLIKERDQAHRELERSTVTAPESGVLTALVTTPGTALRKGDEVARIAQLSSFQVEATLADVHAGAVRTGLAVVVEAAGARLEGVVSGVRPTVEDGAVRLAVTLDQPAHPALRHKLRVDVHVITARRDGALRVRASSFAQPDGSDAAWVVRGDRVRRVPVRLGLRGLEQIELLEGLAAGDSIVVSDMSDFVNLTEVRIR